MSSFADLFNEYRLKAGFQTLGSFGMALANEGFVYEDSMFSKWKSGERAPRDRQVVLAILKVFIKYKAFADVKKANELLALLELRDLTEDEAYEISEGLSKDVPLFSQYKPVVEPSYMYQNIFVSPQNTRLVVLSEMDSPLREYWQFQADCAVAQHFSVAGGGVRTPGEVFNHLRSDEYDNSGCTATIISITADPSTGQEYLSACDRMTFGTKRVQYGLNLMKYIDIQGGWSTEFEGLDINEIGELDRYVVMNWAWAGRADITNRGYSKIVEYVTHRGIKMLYALVTPMMLDIVNLAKLPVRKVESAVPVSFDKNKEGLFLSTFIYGEQFNRLWNSEYFLYRFYCQRPDKL